MTRVSLHHLTSYRFDRPVQIHPHSIRLRPAPHTRAHIHSYSLKVNPEHFLNWQQDPAGNFLARLVFPEKSWELRVQVDMVVELRTVNPFDFFLEPEANTFPFPYPEELLNDLAIYQHSGVQDRELLDWVEQIHREIIRPDMTTVDMLVAINQFVANRVGYVIRMEPGIQSCQQTIESGKGSCRDSSFLLMHIFRRLGLASRFCSGYLIQLKADEPPRKGPAGPEQDFTDLHAWTEVFLPGAGWVGLDPTSGLLTGEGHIPLFSAAEPARAAPVSGATDPCESTLQFEMKVERLQEAPRTTKPYRDGLFEEFQKIVPSIDDQLNDLDMRLTMGGEPTFVSDEDFDSPEWNFQAMAPDGDKKKRDYAERLRNRLVHNLALPSPLFIAGQGKWYPGEPLPRWAYFAHWRLDGHPMSLLYAEATERKPAVSTDAEKLLQALCKRLKLDSKFLQPLHEDPLELLRSEASLPENAARLKELDSFHGLERNRVLRLLEEDLSEPQAYVLPLAYEPESQRWSSSVWETRRSHIFLHPGDSPAGLRLPLGALGDGFRSVYLEDPTELTAHLPDPEHLLKVQNGYTLKDDRDREPLRVALVVEVRQKKLHIFLPPPSSVFSHLSLIAHIESCLESIKVDFVWEGHPPPAHPALNHLSITPDPGVLEVNLQPSGTLQESAQITQVLYRSAKEEGLTTQKFMIDGRPAATGGGNHITLGARSTLESPFLRFPSLLPSLIVYWQRHPALSYLFSGLFIGPTSQAPRIDEARTDTLYDLELALKKLVGYKKDCPPYMIDRLLRHHLTDLTGNTHRAEFCIDKLYDPVSLGGRRGLLEMRAFEMPPHWKMSAVQQALIGAILCFMRKHPPRPRLVRWGLDLRDRFMIPHYIRQDLQEVLDDLQEIDIDLPMELFEPFFEFRFPVYGEVLYPGIRLELRMGLEPWNVLGEEANAGGTSRAVDSATERMQVSLEGDPAQRYELACNGYRVPLKKVGTDKRVAGIRFKAWNPASTMHPHLEPDNPLIFSLFDTYNERYVTGCTYHVAHPGGRSYETLPVNALEAESRRISRFQAGDFGSTAAPAPVAIDNPEFPCTLDLRLAGEVQDLLSDPYMETLQKQLMSGYQPIPGIHDEFLQNGQIRPHYDFLISSLDSLGTERLQQRRNEAFRLLRENGVTYSIYGSPAGENRIWPLDLIPVIIPSDEWSPLERGLIQRAELLDLVLTDLYNQRTAIQEKLLPPDLLFRSPAFLRPCHDLFAPRSNALSYFATDVSRNTDGSFVALGDRIQAPSGSGYSLENRIVLSRVLPSIYRDSQVHRLATYFRTLRRNMIRRAQIRKKDPLTILLSPGPANETYFEHAYLASYLGFTLAQADDLTVREQRLYLKTVEGFQQVDIVFRRIDDAFLDSLELRGDSLLGIPGLLQCVRAGTVTVLNPPGCGILEDRSLLAYLPELSRHFLGEDLILPNVRTYWLGDESHLQEVRHRTDIAIKPTIRRRGEEGYFLEYMDDSDRKELWSRIQERPYNFIAQEVLSGCSCPVFQNGQFNPARGIYRTFIAAADSGYVVLPGGLARFTVNPENFIITNQAGALSKDIWILASEPQKQETLLSAPADATEIFRKGIGLPGRVADNLFWLARYAERAENQCRFLRMIVESSDDGNSVTVLQSTLSGLLTDIAGSIGPQYSEDIVSFMLVRMGDAGSMAHDLQALVQSGRRIRDRLSEDTRRVIAGLESTLASLQEDDIVEASEALFQIILLLTSLTGHLSENMSREASYFFPGFGKRLERSLFLLRLIYSLSRTPSLDWWDLLDGILRINDISITYRRRYRNRMDVRSVLDILLFDRSNPRSLIFQVDEMYSMSSSLPGVENPDKSRERKLALELYTKVHLTEIESLIGQDGSLLTDRIRAFSLECQKLTHDLSDAISDRYFQYMEHSQQLEDLGA